MSDGIFDMDVIDTVMEISGILDNYVEINIGEESANAMLDEIADALQGLVDNRD